MPLWTWIQHKAGSIAARRRVFADTLLARRGVAALAIALVAPLSLMLLGSGMVYASTLTRFATVVCGLTLGIAIFVHGIRPIMGDVRSAISGEPILWNETVLSGITLTQSAYFLFTGYQEFVKAFSPYFYEITASSDANTVSQLGILVLSQFVFLTSLTFYWAGMDRMVHVVKFLEKTYRNRTEGTIGELVVNLPKEDRRIDSFLRLSTVVLLVIIQTKLNLSLLTSMDPSVLSTHEITTQSKETAKTIVAVGLWFVILSVFLLKWDSFVRWHANKQNRFVPTPRKLHRVTLVVSAFHFVFWFWGGHLIPRVPLCLGLAITFFVLFLSWKQLIFIILAPHESTLKVENRGGVT